MALSANEYTYTGGAQTFPVNFELGFIDREDIFVRINEAVDGNNDPVFASFTWIDDSNITVDDPLSVNDIVQVRRVVSKTELQVDFEENADVTAKNLNGQTLQSLMIYQELLDGYVGFFNPNEAAVRAEAAAASAEEDAIQTEADVIWTTANAAQSTSDAAAAAASAASIGNAEANTAADAASTAADRIAVSADAAQVATDAAQVASDESTASAAAASASSDATTASNAASSAATDAASALSSANLAGSAKTASQTAQGESETAAANALNSANAAAISEANTAADLVQTEADTAATAADRIQTGADAAATAADAASASTDAQRAEDAADAAEAIVGFDPADYARLDGSDFIGDINFTGTNSGSGSIRWDLSEYTEDVRLVPFGPLGMLHVVADHDGTNEKFYNFASTGNESNSTVLRRTDGDARYAKLDGATFIGDVTLDNGGGQSTPTLKFDGTGHGFYSNSASIFVAVGGIQAAVIEEVGSAISDAQAVVTKEKGDDRYAALSEDNTHTGNVTLAHEGDNFKLTFGALTDLGERTRVWNSPTNNYFGFVPRLANDTADDWANALRFNYDTREWAIGQNNSAGFALMTRDTGDARFAQLSGGVFTGAVTHRSSVWLRPTSGTDSPDIVFQDSSGTEQGRVRASDTAGLILRGGVNTAQDLYVDYTNATDLPDIRSIVSRARGDARYSRTVELGTQATTSGTSVNFTGIPADVSEVQVIFDQVGVNGNDQLLIRLGDAGGIETTGYVAGTAHSSGDSSSINGFNLMRTTSSDEVVSIYTLKRKEVGSNTWIGSHSGIRRNNSGIFGGGVKTLSGELTQIDILTRDGNAFNNGSINIVYNTGALS